nr:hypothetical protein Iba_chr02aCG6220 [Ipomoea batatas]GMC57572.1 hypothetical protein Iba_chr02aCG6960 [Ipomoea batatas]
MRSQTERDARRGREKSSAKGAFWFPKKQETRTGRNSHRNSGAETGFRICVRKLVSASVCGNQFALVRKPEQFSSSNCRKAVRTGEIFPAVGFSSRSGFVDGEDDEDLNLLMELWSWWRWSFDVDGVLL